VALALIGLVVLAGLEQRGLRRVADQQVAWAVAGYLALSVPAGPEGGFAADRLVSTVSRLEGAAFWHAGLQVTLAGAPILDDVSPPSRAAVVPLAGLADTTTVGSVVVWDAALGGRIPAASWILAAATFLVAGLATTRRAGWLWPALGVLLVVASVRVLLLDTTRTADRVAEASLAHIGPMAALLVLDARLPTGRLAELGSALEVREVGTDGRAAGVDWRDGPAGRMATVQVARGDGVVVELALAPPPVGGRALELGLAGGAIILFLAMFPPIAPRRRPRLPLRDDGARIPR